MESQFDRPVPARVGVEAEKWDLMKPGLSPDIVPLSVADMEFASPPAIIKALEETARSGLWGYTGWGERYFSALRGWMASRHGWDIRREWIIRVNGVVQGLNAAVRALTRPGDGIVIQPPVYPPFFRSVRDNGRTLVENPLRLANGRYEMDFDDLAEKLARPEVAALILCSPHNPVGRVWSEEELRRLGELCLKNHVLVISDEIHCDLIQPPLPPHPLPFPGGGLCPKLRGGLRVQQDLLPGGAVLRQYAGPRPREKSGAGAGGGAVRLRHLQHFRRPGAGGGL